MIAAGGTETFMKNTKTAFQNGKLFLRLFFSMVEMARIELASESTSAGVSPSAAFDLKVRFHARPKAGSHIGYPVVPLCYQELT